jgi:hypothetical protein
MSAARYRKKPVVIEAVQYDGTVGGVLELRQWANALYDQKAHDVYISTLEGNMLVSPGDYVIRGVQGEFYPCKPDIFAATYEAAE